MTTPDVSAAMIGKRVRLSAKGREEYVDAPDNPHDGIGICEGGKYGYPEWPYFVRWSEDDFNDYQHGDIELAEDAE